MIKEVSEKRNKHWTDHELQILELNYLHICHADLAEFLGRTEGSIRNKCYEMGWRKQSPGLTDNELKTIHEWYDTHEPLNLQKLSELIKQPITTICHAARKMGLTQYGRPRPDLKDCPYLHQNNPEIPHPRGMLGKHHSKETRQLLSEKFAEAWKNPQSRLNSIEFRQTLSDNAAKQHREGNFGKITSTYSRCKKGKREDLDGLFVRSSWEANWARYLNWLIEMGEIQEWGYELVRFEFHGIKRGIRSYLPDFRVVNNDGSIEYHEVKGWLNARSKTALKRMVKYYPDIKLVLIDEETYRTVEKDVKPFIPLWE